MTDADRPLLSGVEHILQVLARGTKRWVMRCAAHRLDPLKLPADRRVYTVYAAQVSAAIAVVLPAESWNGRFGEIPTALPS